ncbi:MAG TPA: anaerobic ribonucleoside triphosphate reductase [Acholeplasmatales bacterium]|jgi:anaerobic ribonucleoside-triphosphate reductase|nr:anaerobic ribonucleoside triphosphate reductase [Staphylococcus sp.]CDC69597.1 ribonucleoside-triphosphate reductase class III catalytic subunit [Staphylococcus sp. CAG:324]HAR57769.1 anaerobic ribonucleoside triphosphate reductase [Acholeplasmatales bacterium]
MVKKIIKRDGRKKVFDPQKIEKAIYKAQLACGDDDVTLCKMITNKVIDCVNKDYDNKNISVEEVQNIIENVLIEMGEAEIAKAYIRYRAERTKVRERKTNLMKSLHDITFKDSKDEDSKRENANINADTPMGMMLKYGSEAAKQFYLNDLIKPEFATAHIKGDIHIHDLDFYALTMTCCQIDLIDLFKDGFSTGNGFLREPNGIRSYASLACIAIQANQNDQHGGQSIPNFDYAMALGVRKTYKKELRKALERMLEFEGATVSDDEFKLMFAQIEANHNIEIRMNDAFAKEEIYQALNQKYGPIQGKTFDMAFQMAKDETYDATYQAMEALVHNLNTMHSRAGAQVPFSSLNYGTDTSDEGRMVMHCLLDATMRGLGNGETPIFPIQIFKVKEGINYNPEDPNYDLFKKSMLCSGKRLFPNFSFIDAPYNKQYYKPGDYKTEVAYMGCRTRVIANVYDPSKEIVTGRGNLSFTSINLPRIALKLMNVVDEKERIKKFYENLDYLIDLCANQLLERFEIQQNKYVYNFPFLMGQKIWLDSDKLHRDDKVSEVIKHGTLTIGFIGLAETLKALIGKHHGESEVAQQLGLEIIGHMREKIDRYSKKYKLNFSLIATPAEGLSGRFVKMDRELFGEIEGITNHKFYTNSFHIPVYYNISVFEKIKKEAPYHAFTNGGHISYIEVDGDIAKNLDAFESIIRCMKEEGIGYGAVNHPVDRDSICGYNGIIDNVCPKCGRTEDSVPFERIRRITGYLVGTLDRFNDAKRDEVENRVKHLKANHEN